jgi:23S rRNA (guanine745-N1)-methyltransferase
MEVKMSLQPASNRALNKTLACPVCQGDLAWADHSVKCSEGHCFDVAKNGYLNLLLPSQRKSKHPGDSAEMIKARQSFLNAGFYSLLSDSINQHILEHVSPTGTTHLLDLACGEGYYLTRLLAALAQLNAEPFDEHYSLMGIDISKAAVKAAATRTKGIEWVVANINELPMKENALQILLCMFAIPDFKEVRRVVQKDGLVCMVLPGPHHLLELKQVIYQEIKRTEESQVIETAHQFLSLERKTEVKYEICLPSQEQISNLLMMTPHYYRVSLEGKERLSRLQTLNVTVDARILMYRVNK